MKSCQIPTKSNMIKGVFVILVLGLLSFTPAECRQNKVEESISYKARSCRKHSATLTDFGGVGDNRTSNTKAFKDAIANLTHLALDGGAQLIVPPGNWVTGSFNLTSNFTLFIQDGAVIYGSQDESDWPLLADLPSYGRSADTPGGRLSSLIFGTNLTDVIVTGNGGIIDGLGFNWWNKYKRGELKVTRPSIIEIMYSANVQISNISLFNAPLWHIHPIYSSDVMIQNIIILAPMDSPNTDGINPDSCTNTMITGSYIVTGGDCIAVKSGWDEYGIKVGMPTQQLLIRELLCMSPSGSAIALGSEMSGGIKDVRIDDISPINTESGISIKTEVGRGNYVKDIFVRKVEMETVKYAIWMTGSYGTHPDTGYDPKALPNITNINFRDMTATEVTSAARLDGIANDPFTGICISNVTLSLTEKPEKLQWNCTNVSGVSSRVTPKPCSLLPEKATLIDCTFPEDKLPIESVPLQTCFA